MNNDVLEFKGYAGQIRNAKEYFPHLLAWADFLVQSDELAKAIDLLTNGMPGIYRAFPPACVLELKAKIYRFLMNTSDYMKAPDDLRMINVPGAKERVNGLQRGKLILDEVKEYNAKGITPHIVEVGPGEYWLPIGLVEEGCKFTYQTFFLHKDAYNEAKKYFQDRLTDVPQGPVIYVACEIIEHLHFEDELSQTLAKTGHTAQSIHLSTPLYTFGFGSPNWKDEKYVGLGGHLRTYTPDEFKIVATRLFPGYIWGYAHGEIMSLVGRIQGESQ